MGVPAETVEIRTTGDMVTDVPLSQIGDTALFTRQLDDALLECRVDAAVHSLKDLPTMLRAGISIVAVLRREDSRDALVGRGPLRFDQLPAGGMVATSSLRRRAQLRRARPDLQVVDLRGNVETRLTRLSERPELSGIILATAGLVRLGLEGRIGERLPPEIMLSAPGQGAVAVTARTDDERTARLIKRAVHDPATSRQVAAERALLRRLDGGCQVPIGALASYPAGADGELVLRARVVSLEGDRAVDAERRGIARDEGEAEALGVELAQTLLARGAEEILALIRTPLSRASEL
jgi:hydroxymethylbilane synthase